MTPTPVEFNMFSLSISTQANRTTFRGEFGDESATTWETFDAGWPTIGSMVGLTRKERNDLDVSCPEPVAFASQADPEHGKTRSSEGLPPEPDVLQSLNPTKRFVGVAGEQSIVWLPCQCVRGVRAWPLI